MAGPLVTGWEAYERFRDDYAATFDPRKYSLEWLNGQVWSGIIKAWADDDAGILATVKAYPTGFLELHGMLAAGDLTAIPSLIGHAENWGRSVGCQEAVIESRPGWQRVLKDYTMHQAHLAKEL